LLNLIFSYKIRSHIASFFHYNCDQTTQEAPPMDPAILTALLGFAFVSTITPGPNNLMLMASGANFGFRRTLPHMLGITGGLSLMALLVGAGLMALFDAVPSLNYVLKALSVGYLLWLALKIATAAPLEEHSAGSRPMTFIQAATFQWVNPKAWAMCMSAITLYAPDRSLLSVAFVAGAFGLVCFPAISVWAWLGTVVRQWLSNATRLRIFNITMAALLVASLYPVLSLDA
jgi:threonine/homoserine/homoserine lactone efflux protein